MSSSTDPQQRFDGPPPAYGELFVDNQEYIWKVGRLTIAHDPAGFYLVHLYYGPTLDRLTGYMVVGPREFTALVRDRNLRLLWPGPQQPSPHSV